MRRPILLAAILACLPVLLAGCAGAKAVPLAVKAPPQEVQLEWAEPYPAKAPALVFGVTAFTVTDDGWSAHVSVENTSDIGWSAGDPTLLAASQWGVMLF